MRAKSPITEMQDSFLECHAFGHCWRLVTDFDITVSRGGQVAEFGTHLRCTRCKSRVKFRRRTDKRIVGHRNYDHTDGYGIQPDGNGPQEHHRYRALEELLRRQGVRL